VQSRRDQVQAQSYVLGRLTGALVSAEPDGLENPHRRLVVGTISGILLAVLIIAGFTILGFIVPGGASSWRQPGVLVLEKETGNRYVYVNGLLRPVLNYASARLLFNKAPTVVSVSRASLKDVAHGQPVGIVGAPDALPTAGAVGSQVWTVCAVANRDQAGALSTATTLTIEQAATGARRDHPLHPDQAIVVTAGTDRFLVWQGRRLRLTDSWVARVLGYGPDAFPVETGWLDSVPVGPDIGPLAVPGRGSVGPQVDGRQAKVGELFVARTAGTPERHYLLQRDGLTELTPLAYAIAAADPETTKLYGGQPAQPRELSPGALAQLQVSHQPTLPAGVPDTPPQLAQLTPGGTWCVRQTMADGRVEVTADLPVTAAGAVRDGVGITRTTLTAAAVAVQPGSGGLVLAGRVDQAAGSGFYLVTDAGVKYPLATSAVADQLGYPATGARPVPRRLLDMLPTGPLLDAALAGR
jgi:type VII secretion protein EccB